MVVALLGWGITTYVMLESIPAGNRKYQQIIHDLISAKVETNVKPRVFFEDFPGFVVYVREVPAAGGWTGVLAADTRSPEHPVLFLAARGRMLADRAQRTIQMVLTDGTRHATTARDPDGYEVVRFSEIVLSLDPESVFPRAGPARGEREMSIAELRTRADTLVRDGYSPHNPLMEIHKKFSIPAACLVFALIGVALGASHRKDGKFASFVVGLAVIFVYWGLLLVGQSLAKGQYIGPWLAVWLPNLYWAQPGWPACGGRRRWSGAGGRCRRWSAVSPRGCVNSRRPRSCRACPT